ncbi:MAG: alpha-L-rhamnosidase [Erysipelotrichaceae bacterium]|nr:alpha-L-rhamnosidase [Erysipelotrichaceae bacterium]
MKIIDIRVNQIEKPVGFMMEKPVFSWISESDQPIDAYRICINEDGRTVYDSGFAALDPLGCEADFIPKPRTRYGFVIQAKAGETVSESEPSYFETGMMKEPFHGSLITTADNSEPRHPVFIREFNTDKPVRKARLYISACGLYEADLNGKKIGNEHLTPYCTAYDRWIEIQTFVLDDMIRKENRLEITLGNGWYRGRFGFNQDEKPAYGDTWKLIADLIITYEDGSQEVISTDESWDVSRSNIVFSNIYDGEIVDDTLPQLPLTKAVKAEGEAGRFEDRLSLPVVEKENFRVEIIHTPKNETVLDTGQNMAGSFRLRVHEPKGTKIHLQFSEVMQDECFYRDNLRTAKAEYIYISDGNEHVLEPRFTFYGYRYVKVEGVTDLKAEDFTAYALYSDFPYETVLKTGNEKINRLILNAEWGMKSNYLDVPTDCPQRDERMGWTGDAQVFSPTALYFGRAYAFLRKYLYDMAEEQKKNSGLVPFTVPSFHIAQTATVWGDATVIIPWNMYRFTGDLSILREHYPAMKSWIGYLVDFDGDNHNWRKAFHFGDWLALDGPQSAEAVKGATDDGFIAEVYFRKACLITADTAELLGYDKDAEQLRELAARKEKEILEEYYTPNGRCAVMTQTGQILSVQNGLGSDEKAKELLVKLLDENDDKLATGFVGTPLLNETLSMLDLNDYAFELLFNEEYPGWLYEVNHGATTIWERWNSIDETGHISGTGMNSLNHYSYGSIVEWIFARCAGLKPLEPGFRKVSIAPLVHWKLGKLDCVYPSAAGTYEIHWNIQDDSHIAMKVRIPYGCTAEIELPYFAREKYSGNSPLTDGHVGAGEYDIVYETERPMKDVISLASKVDIALTNEKVKAYLEALPMFEQTEFSMHGVQVRQGLAMCGITDPETHHRIEQDIFALQREDS